MFGIFKNWFGMGIDCTDPVQQQIYCPLENGMSHSSEPIGGCDLDLNGNGICDFIDPVSPFNSTDMFSDSWGSSSSMFDE